MAISINSEPIPHRVYDLSIADIVERRKQSKVFPCGTDVITYLGVGRNSVAEIRQPGKKVWSEKHKSFFAIQ